MWRADLTRMYGLLQRIPRGLDPLRTIFEKHVQTVGEQAISAVAKSALTDPKLYIETILKVFKKYNELVQVRLLRCLAAHGSRSH
jgi:cullin 1